MAEQGKYPSGRMVPNILGMLRSVPDGAKFKELFFYELIENAVNALVKMRYISVVEKSKFGSGLELFIQIVPDKMNNTLSIIDSGIGMTKGRLVGMIGSIPTFHHKGKYVNTFQKYSTCDDDADLERVYDYKSWFGLGFYSSYMVADKVVITTKQDNDEQYVWELDVNCGLYYTISQDSTSGDFLCRGTKVTLFLKENHLEYLEEPRLMILLEKYFKLNHCFYPVYTLAKQVLFNVVDYAEIKQEEEGQILEDLLDVFRKVLRKKVKVVVFSICFPELVCYMTAERTMVINPKSYPIEDLRKMFEANPKDLSVEYRVESLYERSIDKLACFDRIYGTNYYKDCWVLCD